MAKLRAKQYFLNRIAKAQLEEDTEAIQEYQRFLEKCDIIPNKTFEQWENAGANTLHSVNGYKIPKVKSTKPRKATQKVYYALVKYNLLRGLFFCLSIHIISFI